MFKLSVKTPDLRNLEKFYRRAPKQFARASAGMINGLAFETRSAALVQLAGDLVIRDPRFVNSRMQVEKARSGPISGQQAVVGSVQSPRFSGWVEQETGQPATRNRVFTLTARRNREQNRVAPRARLKPGNNITTVNDVNIDASDEANRIRIFIQIMSRRRNEPFIIRKRYKRMRKGVYTFRGKKKLRMLQEFKPLKVQRKPWMQPARARVVTKVNVRKLWAKSIGFVLR